ncbi:MAG: hypothetical protein A3K19_12020 [Lentisphaerae bacterium RIFOXYB12_FULL_65_16]|nr:MAG: hypothetical protein A3K18_10210 [Lentisphaerae bacterium RIFOXYA12_64_32]OGV91080.1 MAG: hypothetical protein A3K19_12020 [Lentisphaerae bacterium RIFOXYB12_FULL_65_16]
MAGERGAALMVTLGVLSVLLVIGLAFASMAMSSRLLSSLEADAVRSRLLAHAGLERAMAVLQHGFDGQMYPGDRFYVPPQAGAWAGRDCLASVNAADTHGIVSALATTIGPRMFTPVAALDSDVGWIPMRSIRCIDAGVETPVIIGRVCYLVLDESGKLDPTPCVSSGGAADGETAGGAAGQPRTGATVSEICLGDAGVPDPDRFRPVSVAGGTAGHMTTGGPWFSMDHVARTLQCSQADMNQFCRVLHPFSRDVEAFWRDRNNNGHWDTGEDEPRLDLSGNLDLGALYRLFVGPDAASGDDDCLWLKELDSSPWVQAWQTSSGRSVAEIRRHIAAQTALNIVDYVDADVLPTGAYLTADGQLVAGMEVGVTNLRGIERGWGFSALAARVDVTTKIVYEHAVGGLSLLPPDLEIYTPIGIINQAFLKKAGDGFVYDGPVLMFVMRGHNQDQTMEFDGERPHFAPTTAYTVEAEQMQLRLFNPTGHGSGQWRIDITYSHNVTMKPDPLHRGFSFRSRLKAQAFFPFAGTPPAPDPNQVDIRATVVFDALEVGDDHHYGGPSETLLRSVTEETTTNVPLDTGSAPDAGRLAYASAYTMAPWTKVTIEGIDHHEGHEAYRIRSLTVNGVSVLSTATVPATVLDSCPMTLDASVSLCQWRQQVRNNTDQQFYAYLAAYDPLLNGIPQSQADFATYWEALPDAQYLAVGDPSDPSRIGGVTVAYPSAPYCDVEVKNAGLVRVGELGRVHSCRPMQSLRLWSAVLADEVGHDAHILDLFKIGAENRKYGKVNPNSLRRDVLRALFARATTVSADAAADAVLARRAQGVMFRSPAECFARVPGLSGGNPASDDVEETAVSRLAELMTVRQNYFTILVTAQAIQDKAGVAYDSDGDGTLDRTAAYNVLDVGKDTSGKDVYVDRILAEKRLLAVVYRDALQNRLRIERLQYLQE